MHPGCTPCESHKWWKTENVKLQICFYFRSGSLYYENTCGWSQIKKWKKTNPIRNWKKSYGNKTEIFVLTIFFVHDDYCAPEGTKKTCIKIHQLCQKKLHYFSILKIVFKTWFQRPCFCNKKIKWMFLRLYMVCYHLDDLIR